MEQKNRKNQQEKTNQEIIDSYDYLSSAASMQDCTGLIPSVPAQMCQILILRSKACLKVNTVLVH